MVLKIQVEFSTPISIQGENAKNSMFVILEPYLDNETSTDVPDWAQAIDAVNNGFKATTTHLGQTFTNVFETNPTNVEVNGKYLKLTLDSYFDDIYKFLKNFHFFYEEQAENGKIIRGDVAASLSQSTKIAVSNSTGLVETSGAAEPLEAKDQFEFKIVKILIKDEEPDKIFYFYTSNRTLKIENTLDGQAINAVNGTFTLDVSNFLDQTFTDGNQYFNTATGEATQFAIDNTAGVTIGENTEGKFFSVQRDSTSGRLTENSVFDSASIETGTYNTTDEFGFPLEIDVTEVDNKIKNPTLHAEIIPSIGGQGYIAIKMSKTNGNSFLNMVGVTKDENDNINNSDSVRTIRHGSTNGDSDGATHPVTGDLSVTSVNAFNNTALDFNFKGNGTQEISSIVTGDELKVEIYENGPDLILMRLNRFPRHGITYSIDYSHQLNLASGFFGPNNNGVLKAEANSQNAISVTNQLKEVTATVGKLKVYYPPSKPGTFSDRPTGTAAATGNFDAYYYVDITFQRADINGDLDITAKYDVEGQTAFGYQEDSGHKIHHGLIISKDSNTAIFEDITRTTIRDENGNPVTLGENSFGKFLRIEVPFAVGNPVGGTAGAYPYDTSTSQLTSNNFADLDSTSPPGILLSDREEKDVGGTGTGSYYYINVMDSQGNVVKPFTETNLQTDTNWGKDKDGNTPSVASIEYKVSWNSTTSEWVKELVLTHHQHLQGAGVVGSLALTNDGTSIDILDTVGLDSNDDSILTVGIVDDDDPLLTSEVAAGNITLAYTKPPAAADNLTNWLGFEIEEYNGDDAKTVTLPTGEDSNPALPSFSSLSLDLENITEDYWYFSVPLTWAEIVDDDGISYEVGVSTDGGSSYTVLPEFGSGITVPSTSNTGATISGLSYGQAYTFRVRASTYEFGPYSSSVSLSAQVGPAGQLSNFSLTNDVGPEVVASWDKPSNVTQFKIEYSIDGGTSWTADEGLGTTDGFVETTDGASTTVSYTFSTLNGNTDYIIRASYSTSSAPYTFGATVQSTILTFPPKVTGLSSAAITTSGFTLSWTAIGGESFGNGEGYTVQQSPDNTTWTTLNTTATTNTTYGVTGLTANTSYHFRVKATNASGSGEWSDSYSVSTNAPSDTSGPNASNFAWQFKRGTAAYQNLSSVISLKSGDKLKVSFDATDATGCIVSNNPAPVVTVGTGSGSSSNIITSVNGDTTIGFTVTMEYEIDTSDTGDISFSLTLTDNSSSTSVSASPSVSGNAVTVTADTTAPTYSSSTAVLSAGTSFSITFDEDIQVGSGGSLSSSDFSLTVDSSTVTGFSVAIDSTDNKIINFTNIPTIYSGESVSLSYTPPGSTGDVNRITDAAGNEVTTFTQSISNNSTQSSQPADTTGPTMTITAATNGVTNGSTTNVSSIVVDFTSSEATTDFLLTDITCGNGSIETLYGSGTSYSGTFSTTSDGACTIDVAGGAFHDAAGNDNTAATQFTWTYDGIAPILNSTQPVTPWQVWTSSNPSVAKTGNMSHIALPGEKIRLYFNTTTTDLSGITVTGIEFNDNGDDNSNNEGYEVSNVTTNVNSGSTSGHYIEYEVDDSSNDMGFPKFKFKLEDTNGNESSVQTEIGSTTLASSVQARQWLHPADNNTEFQVRLIDVTLLQQDYGEVQFDLSYNTSGSDFYQLYDINKIVFNADKDISYNETGLKRTPTWYNEFFWTIDTAKNNNYTMTDTTSNNLFDSNGDYSIKSSAFNNDDSDGKKHEGSNGANNYPGIGGGDKFIEVELHYNIDSTTAAVYRRIFEQKDSNGNLTGTAFTMQSAHLDANETPPTKAYTSVRSMGAAQGVNRYSNNSVNNDDNWADIEDDPYLLALHNFSQKTNANNEPIKSFKLNADYSTVSAKYKFPTYLWGSVLKGKTEDIVGWPQCEAWNGAATGGVGDWPVRRYDVSKNILEYDIKGYYIKAQENNNFDETVLTYDNNGQTDNDKHLIDVDDITSYSYTAKLYNNDPYVDSVTSKQYPEMINYIHRFKMDEMNGTSDNLVKYGISGEKIDWQITPVNEHDFDKINLAGGTGSLSWNSASEYAAHSSNVKQGYIPRLPFNDSNLQDPEFINKSGGTNKSTTEDQFESTYDSSGNFDVSFNYWEEGKQLYFPSNNYDYSYNSVGSIPESKSYFVNKFKFHTDISGATPAFASSINLEMRVMTLDTGSSTSQALYVHGETFDFATGGTNNFVSSSLVVNTVSQYPNTLQLYEGITYIFDVSHQTNSNYEINFSTTLPNNNTTAYASIGSSITRNGTPGNSGATVTIVAPSSTLYIYDSGSTNSLNTPGHGFGGPLMDQEYQVGEEEEEGGSYQWTLNTVTNNGTLGVASVEPDGDYRIKDISWNETYDGIMGNGDTNDISFNVTDLSNNRYYKYYYTITNTLCKTDASGVRFPQAEYNSILTNPANPTAIFNNFENYTDNTETDVAVNAPNAYPAIPLGFFAGGGFGVVAGAPIGVGYGTDVENMLFNVEWKYKERSYAPSSLQREPLGLSSDVLLQNMHDAEAFGYSISMSGDGKTIAVGAPYYGDLSSFTTKMGRVTVFKWRNSRWEMDHFNSGETNSDDSGFGSNNWQHGYSLSLNHNGNVLIVGAPGEHVGIVAKGRARVYLYNEIRNVWDETFNSLLTNIIPNAQTDDRYFPFDDYFNNQSYTECGGSVAVSANGKTIIAGGRTFQTTGIPESGGTTVSIRAGHIQVAFWSDEHQRYQDKISIYFDGVTNSNPSEGPLSTNTIAENWPYEGQDIRAYGPITSTGERSVEFGYSVAASGDGKLFSTGSPFWSGDRNYSNTSAIAFTADGNGDRTGKVALFYRAASSSLPTSSLKTNAHNGLGTSSNVNVLQGNAFADLSEDSNGRYELNKAGFNNSITDMSDNQFGYALSFNNGNRLAVSAPGEDHSNYDYKGSVYIYDCSGTATGVLGSEKVNLICKIKNHDTSTDDEYFGAGLSLSGNGNYVAIGLPYKDTSKQDCGIVQVFKIPEPETITYTVTVQNTDSGNKYYIDGTETPDLDFVVGNTYIFDLSDSSNAGGSNGHPLRFSTTQDGTHASPAGTEFTTGVIATYGGEFGTDPGNNGANITITIQPYSPTLYYYCQYHSGMGGTSTIFLRTATQVGGDISGNDQADFKGQNEDDEDALFGYSVDLNETGDVLCVGAPQDYENGSKNGYAMVFKYDSVNDKWVNVSGKYTDGGNSYTTKNQSSLYDGSRNVVVSGGNLNFTLIESSIDVEDSDALMPFSRGRCPDYGSNISAQSANRTDDNTDWNYSPETTITVGDFEQSDFEVDKLYFNRFVDVASTSPLTLRLSFKNKLGRVYATGPEPQDNDYNSGAGTPSPTLTMFNQFTFDISYNKGSINTPDWVDVSSNVNLNHWTTNGHVGSPVSTGDGLIYTILGADTNQAGTDWESIKPWKDGEGYGTITREDGDVALYFDNQAIKYTENNNITYWTHANSWRWNIRVSYNKGSSVNDKIVSQFNRFTNGEYDGDNTSFEIELAQFTQQSVEIPSPIPNSLSINTLNAPEIIIRNSTNTTHFGTGSYIPYDTPIKIEVRFPRPVYADSHLGNFDNSFFNYLGDSSQTIFDSGNNYNNSVTLLDPSNNGAYGWSITATVNNKWTIDSNTDNNNNSATTIPDFTPDEEIQLLANYINDKYGNPNIASSWIGWQVDFQNAFDNSQDASGVSSTYFSISSFENDATVEGGTGTYNITNIGQNWVGDTLNIKFYKNNNSSNPSPTDFKSNFTITGNTADVTISSGSWDVNNGYYELVLAVGGTANASSSDAIVSLNNSANGTYADTYKYTISFE